LLEEKKLLYLTIEDKDLQINYLNNKQMESFRLTQALMESNERLQEKTLSLSKKIDLQNQEIGQLKKDLDIKKHRLRAFQIATAVTSTIILVKVFLM
jgi:peptidoglycan hydrolase CwlO-like protein